MPGSKRNRKSDNSPPPPLSPHPLPLPPQNKKLRGSAQLLANKDNLPAG